MIATTHTINSVFARGSRVLCKGPAEGPYGRFEARVAAAHEQVVHLSLASNRRVDHLARIGDEITMQVVAPHGWFTARGRRIQNVVPGGITLKLLETPARQERREYLRVRCNMPLWWRPVHKEELATRAQKLQSNQVQRPSIDMDLPSLREIEDPDLARLIKALVRRVDALETQVSQLMSDQKVGRFAGHQDTVVDISGAGMRFTTQAELRSGDTLEATLCLENFGQQELKVLARVVRVDPPNLGRSLPTAACHFTFIDDRDRELIIRFAFREHRKQLRESMA